jgi:ribonuclease Z
MGFFLRWDREGILIDPGEGTQRQLLQAGIPAPHITKILISHFHGDHCLGLPGVVQRLSLARVAHQVQIFYPASGQKFLQNLLEAAIFHKAVQLDLHPFSSPGTILDQGGFSLQALPLEHGVDTWGFRLKEPDTRTVQPGRLPPGLAGRAVGELKEKGWTDTERGRILLQDVSLPRPGQAFGYVMDTRPCENALELARDVDLLVCESTYLSSEEEQAFNYRHLTAGQAAHLARRAGARRVVLAHYSQRYASIAPFAREAGEIHPDVVAAQDLQEIPVPGRKRQL